MWLVQSLELCTYLCVISVGRWCPARKWRTWVAKSLAQSHTINTGCDLWMLVFVPMTTKWAVCQCPDFVLNLWRQEETLVLLLMEQSGAALTLSDDGLHFGLPLLGGGWCPLDATAMRRPRGKLASRVPPGTDTSKPPSIFHVSPISFISPGSRY